MKTLQYAISVQYGQGHHFFRRTDLIVKEEALDLAREIQTQVTKARKQVGRGAVPLVHVWERIS